MIDLRSDTVTKPTAGMRKAIAEAEVGDDVFGEDPTVRALEEKVAGLLGKEAALFVTSGTMGNQLAIACQTRPGDEVLVAEHAHPVHYEVAAASALSGVQLTQVGAGGIYDADAMDALVRAAAYWEPRTALVCVENTHNRAGGRVLPEPVSRAVAERARARGLATHLDGARLWNASVATGISVEILAAPFDTVTVCFSKGLGAPAGSALAGPRELVLRARRLRKMWGGGMRQAGILAAGALFALEHHRARLVDDHAAARAFAEHLAGCPGLAAHAPETNIVNVDVTGATPARVAELARAHGVLVNPSAPGRLRAVFHLDVPEGGGPRAARALALAWEEASR